MEGWTELEAGIKVEDGVTAGEVDTVTGVVEVTTCVLGATTGVVEVTTGVLGATTGVVEVTTGVLGATTGVVEVTTCVLGTTTGALVVLEASTTVMVAAFEKLKLSEAETGDNCKVC